jgi:hypothetical protein
MTNQSTDVVELAEVDVSYWADLLDSLERLEKNEDFKKVIVNYYIKSKALDSVSLLAHPGIKKQGQRADVMEDLVAISNLQYALFMVRQLGEGAKASENDE